MHHTHGCLPSSVPGVANFVTPCLPLSTIQSLQWPSRPFKTCSTNRIPSARPIPVCPLTFPSHSTPCTPAPQATLSTQVTLIFICCFFCLEPCSPDSQMAHSLTSPRSLSPSREPSLTTLFNTTACPRYLPVAHCLTLSCFGFLHCVSLWLTCSMLYVSVYYLECKLYEDGHLCLFFIHC